MNRFVLVSGDFVTTGGMDRANYALASFLARSGRPVQLITHRAADELVALAGVSVRGVAKPLDSDLLGSFLLASIGRAEGRRAAATGARVVVNGGNCDFPDVSWVHYVHAAYEPDERGSFARRTIRAVKHRLFVRAERRCLASARVVIANSARTKRDLMERVSVPGERICVVYLGCDPSTFRPPESGERADLRARLGLPANRPLVLFVGAPGDRRKGFDTLFGAWGRLAKEPSWDALLLVVGGGTDRPAWEARAAGLDHAIQFLGFRRDVPDLMRAADALVAPTRYEPYGLGVQEALCCGLPAFVSAEAGVAERYSTELQALLIDDPNDPNEVAERLRGWRRGGEALSRAVAPLGEELRAWTWDDMAAEIVRRIEAAPQAL